MRRTRDDRGAGTIEYVGALVVAAATVAVLVSTGALGKVLPAGVENAICKIGVGGCADPETLADTVQTTTVAGPAPADPGAGDPGSNDPGSNDPDPAANPDRRDSERGARDDRRGRGDGSTKPNDGLPGGPQPSDSLGEPVPGTSVPEPDPPAWTPVDQGAGEHGSESAGIGDRATDFAAELAANALAGRWPDASRNLLHFLGNSGEPIEQDVNKILGDVPEFKQRVDGDRQSLGLDAVAEARRRGVTGPVTFPVNTPWTGFGYDENGLVYDNQNWFYALGGWQYNHTGQVTVYPPGEPGGQWRYEVKTRVNLRDQYNWDGNKSTQIGPFNVTDEQLAELHRKGLAQEYSISGRSDVATSEGSAP
jgi:hypothetical protein